MPDRLLYQSEAEQLVPERGLVVVEPEVLFSVVLESRVNSTPEAINKEQNFVCELQNVITELYAKTEQYFLHNHNCLNSLSLHVNVFNGQSCPKCFKI